MLVLQYLEIMQKKEQFDWNDYLKIAVNLFEERDNYATKCDCSVDCLLRCSISRSYYVMFNKMKYFAKQYTGFKTRQREREKVDLEEHLEKYFSKNEYDKEITKLIRWLENSRIYRNSADYESIMSIKTTLPNAAYKTNKWARVIINEILPRLEDEITN